MDILGERLTLQWRPVQSICERLFNQVRSTEQPVGRQKLLKNTSLSHGDYLQSSVLPCGIDQSIHPIPVLKFKPFLNTNYRTAVELMYRRSVLVLITYF